MQSHDQRQKKARRLHLPPSMELSLRRLQTQDSVWAAAVLLVAGALLLISRRLGVMRPKERVRQRQHEAIGFEKLPTPKPHDGSSNLTGRDAVEEASWESFPASDSPAW